MITNEIFDIPIPIPIPNKTFITDVRGIWYPDQNVDN